MSHFQTTAATVMIDWGDFSGSPVWPQTETLPWDNGNFSSAPTIVASPSRTGTGAIKLEMGGSTGSIRIRTNEYSTNFDYDIEDTTLGLWVYVDLAGSATDTEIVQIYLPDTATTNGATTNSDAVFFNANYLAKGWEYNAKRGWNYLKFSTADPDYGTNNDPATGNKPVPHYITKTFGTGGTPTTNLKSMQISFANFAAGDTVYVDRLELGQKSETIICFGWDANSTDLIDIAKAKLDEYGYPGYFVVTENNTDEAAEVSRGDTLVAAGWDAVNHTRTHQDLTTATQDDATFQAEIGWSFDKIVERGWQSRDNVKTFAYVNNAANWEAKERIARLYPSIRLARGVVGRYTHFHPACGTDLVPDPLEIGCFNMGNQHSLDQLKATVDSAILLGTSLFIYGHVFETGTPPNASSSAPANSLAVYTDHFEDLVDYINTKDVAGQVRVLTPSQAIEEAEFGPFGAIRGDIIDAIVGDLTESTSWDGVKDSIPHSAVTRVSDTRVCIDLTALQGLLNIRSDETLTVPGGVLSAWTQEAAGNIAVSGSVLIRDESGAGWLPKKKRKAREPQYERRDRERRELEKMLRRAYEEIVDGPREPEIAQEVAFVVRPYKSAKKALPAASRVDFATMADNAERAQRLLDILQRKRDEEEAAVIVLLM